MRWVIAAILMAVGSSAVAKNTFVIDESTPVVFSDPSTLAFEDVSNHLNLTEIQERKNEFVSPKEIGTPKINATYWIHHRMVNQSGYDKHFRIDATGWKNLNAYVIHADGETTALSATGFVPPYNPYLSKGLQHTLPHEFKSPFPVVLLRAGEVVDVFFRVNVVSLFPPKSFLIQWADDRIYSDYRRYSLYLEGLLLGSLLSLTAFAVFNAFQSRDRTDAYYALWITVAFLAVFALGVIDGNRLFEFFINLEDIQLFNQESLGFTFALGFSFAQAVCYVMFARQFLGVKVFYPVLHKVTNGWIAFVTLFGIFSLTGVFYWPRVVPFVPTLALIYSFSVALILVSLFVCSYLRFRSGFGFAKYFFYAIIPYIVFRSNFVFSVIGVPSPFGLLSDQAFGVFLKNPWTNQAVGICLEALIMALAVVSRTQWLQNELTQSAKRQTELIEHQNAVLESTVAQRTQELVEQHKALDASHQVVVGSVNYASRLQRGQLPRPIRLEDRFVSFSALWEPRDTIGGDVYWLSSSEHAGSFAVAVADCTGHGVPGAMLSLLVSNSLERIYAHDSAQDPAAALLSLDHYVRSGLNQDRPDSESDDGCDAVLLQIDRERKKVAFAGAKLGLFHIRGSGELTRHGGARCSLGYQAQIAPKDRPETKEMDYAPGDVFAIATDGVTDQVGGPTGRVSYGYRRLEAMLRTWCHASAEEITKAIREDFAQWQGLQERRDDITLIVFKL